MKFAIYGTARFTVWMILVNILADKTLADYASKFETSFSGGVPVDFPYQLQPAAGPSFFL